MENFLYWWN